MQLVFIWRVANYMIGLHPGQNVSRVSQVKRRQPNLFHAHHPRAQTIPRFFSQVAGGGCVGRCAGAA
jgi:hypothetical protein